MQTITATLKRIAQNNLLGSIFGSEAIITGEQATTVALSRTEAAQLFIEQRDRQNPDAQDRRAFIQRGRAQLTIDGVVVTATWPVDVLER